MVAIQNQLSVLGKLLSTKQQHEQQLQEQQSRTIAASQSQVTPVPTRSRRTSSNHDNNSQSGGSATNHRIGSVSSSIATTDRTNELSMHSSVSGSHEASKKWSRDNSERELFTEKPIQNQSDAYTCVIS